jgi:hypothetical protein
MSKKLYINLKKKYIEQKGGIRTSFKPFFQNNNLKNILGIDPKPKPKLYCIRHAQTNRNKKNFLRKGIKDYLLKLNANIDNYLTKKDKFYVTDQYKTFLEQLISQEGYDNSLKQKTLMNKIIGNNKIN